MQNDPRTAGSSNDEFARARAGKHLAFELGGETYGIEVLSVHEIIRLADTTRVPKTPQYVRGVINLRGKIIPVIDMRLKFGLEQRDDSERTCIIVVQAGGQSEVNVGLVVDEVSEVIEIAGDQIERPPWFGSSDSPKFVAGMGKVEERVVILLDMDSVLSNQDVGMMSQLLAASELTEA
ncbi:MAG: chemotaxis protein CheW [Planctomycetota bacterium]